MTTRIWDEGTELEVLSREGGGAGREVSGVVIEGVLSVGCPVRLVHSEADEVAPLRFATELLGKLGGVDVEMRILKGGGHPFDSPRETAVLKDELRKILNPSSQK